MLKNIVIIPARKGSKRLADKNKQSLNGVPLVLHSINYAKFNKRFLDKIFVSTDDLEIIDLALGQGVEVIERPSSLCGDEAIIITALQHALETINEEVENVVLLQPTNPLRPEGLLSDALIKFNEGNFDSLMTVTRNRQKFGRIKNNQFIPFNYVMGQRSQDLEPLYFENGLLYIIKAYLIKQGKLLGDNNFPYLVDHPFAEIDIDTREELEYAEYLIKRRKK